MKTITITATVLAALAIATVATISNSSVSGALANAEGFAQTSMPIGQIMADARMLPTQSFDAY